ncbi:hypothetical protein CI102_5540 [Trichoderma harzianum]|nr:hypothetical protein CI102_5540 [Trichoderma harzianum]
MCQAYISATSPLSTAATLYLVVFLYTRGNSFEGCENLIFGISFESVEKCRVSWQAGFLFGRM